MNAPPHGTAARHGRPESCRRDDGIAAEPAWRLVARALLL
jgi:hypothetical protein